MTLTLQGHITKSHVLFLIRASKSNSFIDFQLGSDKERVGYLGRGGIIGSTMETKRLKSFLGL